MAPNLRGDTGASSSPAEVLGRENQWSQSCCAEKHHRLIESRKWKQAMSFPPLLPTHQRRCSTAVTWVLSLGDSLQKGRVSFQGHVAQTTHWLFGHINRGRVPKAEEVMGLLTVGWLGQCENQVIAAAHL